MKIGVIGVGHLGQYHVKHLARNPQAQLVGIYDTDSHQASKIAKSYNIPVFHSTQQMADLCDGVTIAVPTPEHFNVARFFLSQGKHCLVEKPLTSTLEQAEELINLS